jgi:hypothetical protein
LGFLSTPRSLYLLENGWTEPLLCAAFAAVVFWSARGRPRLWLPLAAFFAMKQYTVVFAPLTLLLFPRRQWREAGKTVLVAGALAASTLVPFLIWDAAGLVRDLVVIFAGLPFFPEYLTYRGWWASQGVALPAVLPYVLAPTAMALVLWRARPGTLTFTLGTAISVVLFFGFSKHGTTNYYYFAILALWSAIAAATNGDLEKTDQVLSI